MANEFSSTISNVLGKLKIYYEDGVRSQFNDEVPFYNAAEKGKSKWNGKQVNVALGLRRNPGIATIADGAPLPSISYQGTDEAQIFAKFAYLRFGITGPMIKASKGAKGAFVDQVSFNMERGMIDLKNDLGRQAFWNGRGDLCSLQSAALATNVITVTGRTPGEPGAKYLDVGTIVDIVSIAGVVKAASVTITAVSSTTTDTASITLNAVVNADAGDILTRPGSFNNETQGIRTLLDNATTTVYGIDRSQYPIFNGYAPDALGTLSLDLMEQYFLTPEQRSGKTPNALFADYLGYRAYNKLLVADKRYINVDVKGDGTFTKADKTYLSYAGVPVVRDKDCTGRTFIFAQNDGWMKYVLCEMEWADETGSYMIAQTGADAFEVRLRQFFNYFHKQPNSLARLSGWTQP